MTGTGPYLHSTDALVDALEASEGLPVLTPRGYAARVEEQLGLRGYEIRRIPHPVTLKINGYPCTCESRRGCLEHPFMSVEPRAHLKAI